ncbi:MAG: maltose alpha-D-glucosyltransferase [Candidatus Caenarcaniphilales bacterium]|nr:maltose alpha-D-glucosyltransferase [Candidatus Caenarcaniphilales bacterium]
MKDSDIAYHDQIARGSVHMKKNVHWFQDAVFYQLHVKYFFDSNGDGYGDFLGLAEKLPYLRDLGINCLWLMPFFESPMFDDGYDVADYYKVKEEFGTLEDFKYFMKEAHKNGIRVIADLVMNHTSIEHHWFQEARRNPESKYRDYYVWSDTKEKYVDAPILFDQETSNWTWDEAAEQYYWHRFYSSQPDLNFENPEVVDEFKKIVFFWLDLGLDGFRCDAVPFLFEEEGTDCQDLPATHQFFKDLRAAIDERYQDKILLAECAFQYGEELAEYFSTGDEFHMSFHFPIMTGLFYAIKKEHYNVIEKIVKDTPHIPDNCQYCLFLRSHDQIVLDTATEEQRDFLFQEYAPHPKMIRHNGINRRLTPMMENSRRKILLLNSFLFSFPGTPIIYYGDEIGMGDNIYLRDRDGLRTPMQWNENKNAGFSTAEPQALYLPINTDSTYGFHSLNVETVSKSPTSLYNQMRRLIKVRQKHAATFGRGSIRFIPTSSEKAICYLREYEDDQILVVANLSGKALAMDIDLSEFEGKRLIELKGDIDFPVVKKYPYQFTMLRHTFFWLKVVD